MISMVPPTSKHVQQTEVPHGAFLAPFHLAHLILKASASCRCERLIKAKAVGRSMEEAGEMMIVKLEVLSSGNANTKEKLLIRDIRKSHCIIDLLTDSDATGILRSLIHPFCSKDLRDKLVC